MKTTERYYKRTIQFLLLSLIFFVGSVLNFYIHSKLYIDEGVTKGFFISILIVIVSFLFYLLGCTFLTKAKGYSGWLGLLSFIPLFGPLIIFVIKNKNDELKENRKLLKLYFISITLISIPLLFLGVTQIMALYQEKKNNTLQIIAPDKASEYITTFAKNKYPIGFTGLDFYNHKLFVGSNPGVLQFNGMNIESLYHWDGDVSQALSVDHIYNLYWMYVPNNRKIYNFNGVNWQSIPQPGLDGSTRGDALSGIKTFQDKTNYWIIYAGKIWRYDAAHKIFAPDNPPPNSEQEKSYKQIKYATVIGGKKYYIFSGGLGFLDEGDNQVFYFDNGWKEVSGSSQIKFDATEIISTGNLAYIRTRTGKLLQLNPTQLSVVEIPGFCNAIAISTNGSLVASFLKKGIYIYQLGNWRKLYDYPEVEFDNEHSFVYIAEDNGKIAFSIDIFQTKSKDSWKIRPHLWISDKNELKEIIFY